MPPKVNATFDQNILQDAVDGQVVTRFPPEPSGYLHIGHAKAAVLNQYFAQKYHGKFLVRFDDTNPSKETGEFEQSILEDMALLGVYPDALSYTSDFLGELEERCRDLIKKGLAYADDTPQEQLRAERMDGIASYYRDAPVEDTLKRFEGMLKGETHQLENHWNLKEVPTEPVYWFIRAKVSVDDPNKAMRDPVIYRVNLLPHHRTGDKYKAYPTYDFACPVVDSLQGVTHALRTNEYRDRNAQYEWMLKALGLRHVHIWDFGRINFVYTLMSKRKLKALVDEGRVRGWDDPRFPTVRGIRRRGMTIEAIRDYMLQQGPSTAFTNLEWDQIWTLNKKVIDPVAPRFFALEDSQNKRKVKVDLIAGANIPEEPVVTKVPLVKKDPALGDRDMVLAKSFYIEQEDAASFEPDEEITLMSWGNAFVRGVQKQGDTITHLDMELNLAGDFKKTKKKVTWIAEAESQPLVSVILLDYDYILTKKKILDTENADDFINDKTEYMTDAVACTPVKTLKKGEIIQFERKGFYSIDKAYGAESYLKGGRADQILAIHIPDGRASSVSLKAPLHPDDLPPSARPPKATKDKPVQQVNPEKQAAKEAAKAAAKEKKRAAKEAAKA